MTHAFLSTCDGRPADLRPRAPLARPAARLAYVRSRPRRRRAAIQAEEPPPPLPEYEQPPLPAPGYYWTPGYWAWNNYDYYWVPESGSSRPIPASCGRPATGASSTAPTSSTAAIGVRAIGFYGGIHYGFGYGGCGL